MTRHEIFLMPGHFFILNYSLLKSLDDLDIVAGHFIQRCLRIPVEGAGCELDGRIIIRRNQRAARFLKLQPRNTTPLSDTSNIVNSLQSSNLV